MSEQPIYDAVTAELGDPHPIVDELAALADRPAPVLIEETP